MVFVCLEIFFWEIFEFCLLFWYIIMNKFLVFDILVILNYLKKCYLDCFYYFKNILKIFIKRVDNEF